jgi:hypothetical protein
MGVGAWLAKSEWLLTADRPQAKHHSPDTSETLIKCYGFKTPTSMNVSSFTGQLIITVCTALPHQEWQSRYS